MPLSLKQQKQHLAENLAGWPGWPCVVVLQDVLELHSVAVNLQQEEVVPLWLSSEAVVPQAEPVVLQAVVLQALRPAVVVLHPGVVVLQSALAVRRALVGLERLLPLPPLLSLALLVEPMPLASPLVVERRLAPALAPARCRSRLREHCHPAIRIADPMHQCARSMKFHQAEGLAATQQIPHWTGTSGHLAE